ncbi:hypothetical protein MNBD_GAMMA24-2130 [hydrothermal vent metagenome]|uniref:AB hydrolase-1 domain-containing protein n=1 Tax=hydrothermal vent metagenome TaxID=652676 RepID=A0A3B1BMF7_9ZZZZ
MRKRPPVVLVHGIWMTGIEMLWLRYRLHRCGYQTYSFHYPSLRRTPSENAASLNRFLKKIEADRIHLLAHSLGGIVLMHLFHRYPQQKPGRVVMLGTPAKGSELARRFYRKRGLRLLLGRACEQGLLGGAPDWPEERELGLIIGDRPLGMLAQLFGGPLEKPSDGTVRVAETRIEQALEVLCLPVTHFSMLADRRVAVAACRFLRAGKF